MASNFKISVHRNSDNLHLVIQGDFDGVAAHALLHSLRNNYAGERKIFFHTDRLRSVHPFGAETFANTVRSLKQVERRNLIFTGELGGQIAPEDSICL